MTEQELALKEMEIHYTPRWDKPPEQKITSSQIASKLLYGIYNKATMSFQEECFVLYLNRANVPLGIQKLSKGGITGTVVDVRIILATALKSLATGIIVAHNHPSGQLKPSQSDIELTKRLKSGCDLLDIAMLDHIVLTPDGNYYSFADEGCLN